MLVIALSALLLALFTLSNRSVSWYARHNRIPARLSAANLCGFGAVVAAYSLWCLPPERFRELGWVSVAVGYGSLYVVLGAVGYMVVGAIYYMLTIPGLVEAVRQEDVEAAVRRRVRWWD